MKRACRAFTLLEAVIVVVVVLLLLGILIPAGAKPRVLSRQFKDATQIRGIHQGMVTWAGNCQDDYPLPGKVDILDTIPGIDTSTNPKLRDSKNIPRWALSLMVYNGNFGPELLVGPAEVNPAIRVNSAYEFTNPTAVAPDKRAKAILDPSFAAYPDEPGGDSPVAGANGVAPGAGNSYAFLAFAGERRKAWQSTFDGTQAVVANRGPWYTQDAKHDWSLNRTDRRGTKNILATESNTLLIHGSRTAWEGNSARNDGSVNFETRPDPQIGPLLFVEVGDRPRNTTRERYDNLFTNEDEDSADLVYSSKDDDITEATNARRNNYLRCFGDRATRRFDDKTGQLVALGGFWYD
jgi:type II secretory pathway pseudopilin PulG